MSKSSQNLSKWLYSVFVQIEEAKKISGMLADELLLSEDSRPTITKLRMSGNPEASLEVGGCYVARLYDDWHRVAIVELTGSDKVVLMFPDYRIYQPDYQVINIYDLPESLDFTVIPPALR